MSDQLTTPENGEGNTTLSFLSQGIAPQVSYSHLEQLQEFVKSLDSDVYGYRMLVNRVKKYTKTYNLMVKQWKAVLLSVDTVQGVRKSRGVASPVTVARKHYLNMSTKQLRKHCEFWGIKFTDFESMEDAVEAILEKEFESHTE